ncbi:hypothetical protein PP914_gp062 [Arthrobacter phage Qui]|jgi:hypothetical protein|uniref:Uncharacterized protein n=1 Tax=Arthrobacter phage Qui TaxID=2603260 RepID=A0A5B8WLS5_9CAUD|nr:hypothetical protein PP914_gp062 [Arthrobacter phage Qui]QED11552.1 hypothetical protein SEA_QUI_62 [Arthrobacter phage Qui]QOC56384.1 hypothetical protein SEA_PAELLA_62 [Arthrobacter phage Paella]
MNADDLRIYKKLQERPEEVYINPDGTLLYALVRRQVLLVLRSEVNLYTLTDDQINNFIIESLTK